MPSLAEKQPVPAESVTPRSLQAFLYKIIDYAGLFPPASLSLPEALDQYVHYRVHSEAWLLSRFACPAVRLDELSRFADLFSDHPPFRFSVLATGGTETDAFLRALGADLTAVHAFLERHPGHVHVDVLEARLPSARRYAAPDQLLHFFTRAGQQIQERASSLQVFYEVPLDADVRRTVPAALEAMAAYNAAQTAAPPVGFKMRCGGTSAGAVPPPDRVAFVIAACREAGVRFKATAGLHHPLRHHDATLGTAVFGFFNVFGAAVLAAAHGLDERQLRDVLVDDTPPHFHFDDEAFAWKNFRVPTDMVQQIRRNFALSFGSCSFAEPREDLIALGLL